MRITCLIDDTPGEEGLYSEHGLSLFISSGGHTLVFDTGATGAAVENARRLGLEPALAEMIVISHGHYDHAGGLSAFAEAAPDARILIRESALLPRYRYDRFIGARFPAELLSRTEFTAEDETVSEGIRLFSGVRGVFPRPFANDGMLACVNGVMTEDRFEHEQYLYLTEGERRVLISGCAHNGVPNILTRLKELGMPLPDRVITGFHMARKTEHTETEKLRIRETAEELGRFPCRYVTGHCTGNGAFILMKEILGDRLTAMRTGSVLF